MATGDRHIFRAQASGGLPYCGAEAWDAMGSSDTGRLCESCQQIDLKEATATAPKTVKRKKGKAKA